MGDRQTGIAEAQRPSIPGRACPVRKLSCPDKSGPVEEGQAAGVVGVHLGVHGAEHQGQLGMPEGNLQGSLGHALATGVRVDEDADPRPLVPRSEVIEIDRADDAPVLFDDPAELARSVQILMALAQGLECRPRVGG